MSTEAFLTSVIVALVLGILFLATRKSRSKGPDTDSNLLALINDLRKEIQATTNSQRKEVEGKLDQMHDRLVQNMQESSSTLQKHFRHTSVIIKDVTERLTQLDDTNKQVL